MLSAVQETPKKGEKVAKKSPVWQVVRPANVIAFTVQSSIMFDVVIFLQLSIGIRNQIMCRIGGRL